MAFSYALNHGHRLLHPNHNCFLLCSQSWSLFFLILLQLLWIIIVALFCAPNHGHHFFLCSCSYNWLSSLFSLVFLQLLLIIVFAFSSVFLQLLLIIIITFIVLLLLLLIIIVTLFCAFDHGHHILCFNYNCSLLHLDCGCYLLHPYYSCHLFHLDCGHHFLYFDYGCCLILCSCNCF